MTDVLHPLVVMAGGVDNIKIAFDENGISIPYPQTDLHVHAANPAAAFAAPAKG